jgi:3-carboxy-cis,cis-muconate cycloisomerase
MSSIFEGGLSTPEVMEAFGERNFVAAMLRFEAALARAQAVAGLIPHAAAQSIIGTCKVDLFDVAKIVRESGRAGNVAVPLIESLKDTVGLFNPAAVAYVHFGSTSQDVIDTSMALITREALQNIQADVDRSVTTLLSLAEAHADTPVLARTLMQSVSVTSFGLKCSGWAAPLIRSLQRLHASAANALCIQLGGTVGTLDRMADKGREVTRLMAQELGLGVSPAPWHTQRDEWVALGCEVGLLVGGLGKIALDISLLGQNEVGEVTEAVESGRLDELAVTCKHSPVACMVALVAARRVPQRVAALLAAMPQEHERALGAWQTELAEWAQLMMSAHGSARAMAQALPRLRADAQRMRVNIEALRQQQPKEVADQWFAPELAAHAAQLAWAQVNALRSALAATAHRAVA